MDQKARDVPVLYVSKDDCCGCSACFAICPEKAITMEPDNEGFVYPVIDEQKCSRCYRCKKTCPFQTRIP